MDLAVHLRRFDSFWLLAMQVVLMGKPAPVIYEAAAELLSLQPHELVAIGDSLVCLLSSYPVVIIAHSRRNGCRITILYDTLD